MSPYYKHLAKSLRWILLAELDANHESRYSVAHYSLSSSLSPDCTDCTKKSSENFLFHITHLIVFSCWKTYWEFQVSVSVQPGPCQGSDTSLGKRAYVYVNMVQFSVFTFFSEKRCYSTVCQSPAQSQGCCWNSSFLLNLDIIVSHEHIIYTSPELLFAV